MLAHETTEENNENREYSRERVANSKNREYSRERVANNKNREWQTRERRGLPVLYTYKRASLACAPRLADTAGAWSYSI